MSYTNVEKTLIMIRPDGVQRGLVGKFISRFEKRGMKLVGIKMCLPEREQLERHFWNHTQKDYFEDLMAYMQSGPICVMVWAGNKCIDNALQIIGAKKPFESAPGTIRGDYGVEIGRNLVSGSNAGWEALKEIQVWFPESEGICRWDDHSAAWIYENRANQRRAQPAATTTTGNGEEEEKKEPTSNVEEEEKKEQINTNASQAQAQQVEVTDGGEEQEVVLATSAGFTEQVAGHSLELNDLEKAYNKVRKDWNITSHTGYKVDHGYGHWSIRQLSATNYRMVSSHNENVMQLKLPLSQVPLDRMQAFSNLRFKCDVQGWSCDTKDKYRIVFKLLHNTEVVKNASICEDDGLLVCKGTGEIEPFDLSIDLSDIVGDSEKRMEEYSVFVEVAGKDVEYWAGNHGAAFSDMKLFLTR